MSHLTQNHSVENDKADSRDTSTARNNILNKLRSASTIERGEQKINYHCWGKNNPSSQEEKVTRFIKCMTANHAEIIRIPSSSIEACINTLVTEKGFKTAATGCIGKYSRQISQALSTVKVNRFHQPIEGWKSELFNDVDVGITHTLAGIADTGALVLWPDRDEPRTLSLVPPCHIAIIDEFAIYNSFSHVMQQQNWCKKMPTNALLISGPSKTADIQQTLAYGAHGPSELIVILVSD
jgi:L-lactate dehydrogenase complex protein LldG